jgi:hypothetical protein
VLAKTLARYALEVDGRLQKTVVLAMAAVDHDFDAIAAVGAVGNYDADDRRRTYPALQGRQGATR